MALASAGPYANHLHLSPDRQPCQYLTTQFFTGQMPFLLPNQQCQSTEGNVGIMRTLTDDSVGCRYTGTVQDCTSSRWTYLACQGRSSQQTIKEAQDTEVCQLVMIMLTDV